MRTPPERKPRRSKREDNLRIWTLDRIEEIAVNHSNDGEDCNEVPAHEVLALRRALAKIYTLSHNANSPTCRKNHPTWNEYPGKKKK